MSVVTVNVGGRTVPVRVQTYQFGDMSASASVQAAIVSIAANVANAEAAEDGAVAAQQGAETAEDNAVIAKDLAEEYRDETAVYAGTTNLDDFYLNTAAGLAATPSGSYFGVPGTDGVAIYRDNAGVADAGPVMPSIDYIGKRPQFIKCVAGAVTSGNSYPITPVDTNIRYSGTGEQYVWVWEAPAVNDQGSGSVDVTIKNGAGTTFATISIRKRGNAALEGSEFQTGDLIMARRQTSAEDVGQRLLWMAPPNSAVRDMAPLIRALDTFGPRPSVSRPLHYEKAGIDQHVIRMLLTADKYADGMSRRQSDCVQITEHDMSTFQADTGNCLSLNSIFSHVWTRDCHDLSMMFDSLSGGITVDTGQVPTTLETPVIGGKFGDAANLYTIAGAGHGFLVDPTSTLTTTLNDATTAGVDSVSTIDVDADIATPFRGDKIVKVMSGKAENAAHDIYCRPTWTVTYDPAADNQIVLDMEWDFTHADVTVTPGFLRGFANLFAGTDLDTCQPYVGGVAGAVTTINLRDDTETTLSGHPEKVIFWHSDFPEKQIVVTNLYGYGVPFKINDVAQPNTATDTYIDNFDWGIKLYMNPFGDQSATTPVDASGQVYTSSTGIRFQIGEPIV